MRKEYISIIGLLLCALASNAQTQQIKHVACTGGDITSNGVYSSISVVGQLAASEFSKGSYSGSIGYLDNGDIVPNNIPAINNEHSSFRVYPNPSSGDIWVDCKTEVGERLFLIVTDAVGKRIFQEMYPASNNHHVLLSGTLFPAAGIYHISVQLSTTVHTEKLTVIK